jgi:hypothetical protein
MAEGRSLEQVYEKEQEEEEKKLWELHSRMSTSVC